MYLGLIAPLISINVGYSQQDVQLSQFMFDRLSINPASAGMSNAFCVTGIYRNQWVNFDGAPQTTLLNSQLPVKTLHGGLGFTYYNDQLGFESNNIARLHYSYHTHLSAAGLDDFAVGASVGLLSKAIKANWITPSGGSWMADPNIAAPHSLSTTSDFSVGVYYRTPTIYLGLSSTHLTENSLKEMNLQTARHYWIMAGYKARIASAPQWEVRPNVLVKSDGASTQLDVNAQVYFRNQFWGGLSYRVADAVVPMIGWKHVMLNSTLSVGYSYDVTTSKLSSYSNGTHEIVLGYCLHKEVNAKERYTTPR